ncbi:hypothetical protein NX059_000598 [Plenodomus lindquistii]|nr:hypothetical protein NX059_000598 [Plenodomus lindquistii]
MELDPDAVLDDESALEYARYYGLCADYTSENWHVRDIVAPSDDDIDRDLRDLSATVTTDQICALTKERLSVSRDAALLLKAVLALQAAPAEVEETEDRRKWMLSLRQEVPVLKTDHELDMLRFGSVALPDLRKSRIPSEMTNAEKDEGFEWPSKYFAYPAQCDKQLRAEKLGVTKEVLLCLQGAVKDDYKAEDLEDVMTAEFKYMGNVGLRPLTPPLLPLSPPMSPYIPSSPANRLPLPSDGSDSVIEEAKALERRIMNADSLQRKGSDSSDSMLLDIIDPSQFSPLSEYKEPTTNSKRKAEDLKVEGPLTPPMFSTSPMKKLKSVSFADIIAEYIPTMKAAESVDEGDDSSVDFSDYDDFMREIEPLAVEAQRKIEHEKLSYADTAARIEIPELDFTLPMAPWNTYSLSNSGRKNSRETELDAQSKFLLRIKREDLKTATPWHGVPALERQLQWNIFTTRVSAIELEEKLHGETEFNKTLAELTNSPIVVSESLIWKREGLRIFDEEEEEEIESEEAEERRDMEALIRKRKLEMEEEAAEQACKRAALQSDFRSHGGGSREQIDSHYWENSPSFHHRSQNERSRTTQYGQARPQEPASRQKSVQPPKDTGNELMFGGFSASTALHKFMKTRGKSVQTASHLHEHPTKVKTQVSPVHTREPSQQGLLKQAAEPSNPPTAIEDTEEIHLPPLPTRLPACSFIVSTTLLLRRSLLKKIEFLYPTAEILYRDYALPHSPSQEADMILSPSTGLVFTTLQNIKQRALPGRPDRSPLKERIVALQTRYERLLVMVSEGLSRDIKGRPRDETDQEALRVFEAFAEKLEGEVQVVFVRGGEDTFTRGVVRKMAEFGLEWGGGDLGDVRVLSVETSWETFLRRAGLNPFAAQVIVASLKDPFDVQIPVSFSSPSAAEYPGSVQVFGLPAFLVMSEEERLHRFQALMGGRRILRRVSKLVDQQWVSAAHGFKI